MTEGIKERQMPAGERLTFEELWAMAQEDREQLREMREQSREQSKESDRKLQEMREEFSEMFKKTEKILRENELIVKRNSKQLGEVHRKFGKLAVHLVLPGIERRFNEMGIYFQELTPKGGISDGYIIKDKKGKEIAEVDILLMNGEIAVAIEVKTEPAEKDIEHHIKRLQLVREFWDRTGRKQKKLQGGIAGAIYDSTVKKAVKNAGFYVIEQSGDTMMIDMSDGFVPKEW
jgi:hypothetical protein